MILKKNLVSVLIFGFILGNVFSSCSSDDDAVSGSRGLREVKFHSEPDMEISKKFTGNTSIDADGVPRKEYEIVTRRYNEFSVADLMSEANIEKTILYPGSILRGESFLNGKYDPVVLHNSFNPVTLFLTIQGVNVHVKKDVIPKGSEVFQALSDLKLNNTGYFPEEYIPANYTYESEYVTTEESFKKTINLHIKANFAGIANSSFDYNYNKSNVKSSSYILVKLRQTVYSAGIDPVHWSNWVQGDISVLDSGPYEPVYISSIDYGRVAYLLIETKKSSQETGNMVKGAVDFKIGRISAGGNYQKNEEFKKLFNSNKIKVSVLGGPSEIVTNYDQFMDYMNLLGKKALVASSAPISYTIRRLKDNTQVDIVNTYEELKKEYR